MTHRSDATSFKNGTTVNGRLFNVSDYHQTISSVRIVQIKNQDISFFDANLSAMTSVHAFLRMHGFDYSRGKLLMAFHIGVSADDLALSSIRGLTIVRHVMNNRAKVFFLDGCHLLQAMRQLHV